LLAGHSQMLRVISQCFAGKSEMFSRFSKLLLSNWQMRVSKSEMLVFTFDGQTMANDGQHLAM
jgi:hypothetical protein